jgi:hypothetical protein
MSEYLAQRLESLAEITIHTQTEVTDVIGDQGVIEEVWITTA